jgi:hypothetical protein
MVYEAAAAIALRDHLRRVEEKGGARSHGRLPKQVEEERVAVMSCGIILGILKWVRLQLSGTASHLTTTSGSGKR